MKNQISIFVRLQTLSLLVILVGGGCADLRSAEPQADHPKEKASIERRLQEIFVAAESKDFERLESYHAYGPKFTKYAGASAVRQDASAGRKGERVGLGAVKGLKMQAGELKIDVFGKVGIATFVLDYHFDAGGETVYRQDRSTLVFINENGDWKIVHEHLTPIQH